jgi:hypothetical protein
MADKKILTNDIKKGDRCKLRCGWYGTMKDNAKGVTRTMEVEGDFTEIGSVYSHDIVQVIRGDEILTVEHTAKQLSLKKELESMGW